MEVAPFILVLYQVGNDFIHQPFSLVMMVHGHAAQGVAETAAGGNGMVVIIEHHTGIIQVGIRRIPSCSSKASTWHWSACRKDILGK